jgi:23S rRNA (guanosine2251-2'-O)-methyltransferase
MKQRRVHAPRKRPAPSERAPATPTHDTDTDTDADPEVAPNDHELLYGRQTVRELLRARRRTIHRVTLLDSALSTPEMREIEALARKSNTSVTTANRQRITMLAGDVNHQGVVAETGPYPYLGEHDLVGLLSKRKQPFVLVLDHLEDVQNVGSLIRTADAAGVDAVVIANRRAARVTPAAVRVSAGAAEHMKIAAVPNIVRTMSALAEIGLWFVGLEATEGAVNYTDQSLTGSLGLVVGSEGTGMRRQTRQACDHLITLPQLGSVASLNAAVAGAIAMFECRRQRSAASVPPAASQ